jgi:hypothetical protein
MSLRIVGAGLGRTGTLSLKVALEKLLGAPCYHMAELIAHPDHVAIWHAAARGEAVDWRALFSGYRAAVDWPAAAFWEEIAAAYPDALILLSVRDAESWWKSASTTIFPTAQHAPDRAWRDMIDALFTNRFTRDLTDREACIAAYERHGAHVRAAAPRDRLVEWRPGDGWEPLCRALGIPAPAEPFPHTNTSEEFLARATALAERRRDAR